MKSYLSNTKYKIKNKNRGISLVALIITIIVLLILATVSIRLVINVGIMDKTKRAVDQYSEEEIQEQLKLVYSEYQMGQFSGGLNVQDRLEQIFGEGNVSDVTIEEGKLKATIKINGEDKTFNYNGKTGETKEIKPQTIGTLTKDNYGDYIDLGESIVRTPATTDDWRILYNDTETNKVYAILTEFLPETIRIPENLGLSQGKNGSRVVKGANSNVMTEALRATEWKQLLPTDLQSNDKINVLGGAPIEIILRSYNEKHNTNLSYSSNNSPVLYKNGIDDTEGVDDLYVPYPSWPQYGAYGYWSCTPVEENSESQRQWAVGLGGDVHVDYSGSAPFSIVPVVIFDSDITVEMKQVNNQTVWTLLK